MAVGSRNVFLIIVATYVLCGSHLAYAQTLSQKLLREPRASLIADVVSRGDAARGAVLFAEQRLACANCHAAGRKDMLGPDLNHLGEAVSNEKLVEALLEPSKTIRKGFETVTVLTDAGKTINGRIVQETRSHLTIRDTSSERRVTRVAKSDIELRRTDTVSSMPRDLADQLEDRQQFLDLMRYVIEIVAAGAHVANDALQATTSVLPKTNGGAISEPLQGLVMLNEFNCAACHRLDVPQTALSMPQAPNLEWIGSNVDPQYILKFLTAPHIAKPSSKMPDMLHSMEHDEKSAAVLALTHYITSLGDSAITDSAESESKPQNPPPSNLGSADEANERGRDLFHSVGCIACHSPRDKSGNEILSDDSVSLETVEKYNPGSLVEFLKAPHLARPAGRMPNMQLTHWEAIDIANYLLSDEQQTNSPSDAYSDKELITKGQRLFQSIGCVSCHKIAGQEFAHAPRRLDSSKLESGCLSDSAGEWPQFNLSLSEKQLIKNALRKPPSELGDEDQIAVNLTALRCLNCHSRGELGGVSNARDPHFQTTNPNLGPQGRIPPTLTGVGAKLKPTWMRQVMVSGRNIRPYVKTRMPLFGVHNVAPLVDLFQRADHQPALDPVEFSDQKEMRKAGLELAGTKGLNCIVCHTFQLKPSATMPAVDLTNMAERLHKDWFHRFMRAPQQMSLNTVMPSFWPGGKAIRKSVLSGKPDQQIEALWQYLLDGRQARAPQGLMREPMELLATDEAVMLRRSYPGIGKRGIGVGYPAGVNLAFDAEQLRLAMIWSGKFADPGGVWRSQGHGQVRPLERPIQFLKGPDIDGADSQWTIDDDRPPEHQFKGYSLDDNRRPRFLYQIGDVTVQDYYIDVVHPKTKRPILRRTVSLRSESTARKLIFRVANGKTVSATGEGAFLIDTKLRVHIGSPHKATIAESDSDQKLLVLLNIDNNETTVVVDYAW